MSKKLVVAAMSGGVDSSVAAALLLQKGYEVVGITMCFNLADSSGKRPSCCGVQGIEDARKVCAQLGIRHYVLNLQKVMNEKVIADFCAEYLAGRTPNPCVRCNQFVKFEALLKKTKALGAQYLATGHYARVQGHKDTRSQGHKYKLIKAKDKKKDQSYFLYRLSQEQLAHILFPLGNLTKVQVREKARRLKLPVAEKLDSQEICFLPDMDYRAYMRRRFPSRMKPGEIVDTHGKVLGRHQGIACFTVGQREGLGIALGHPAYITKIDAAHNRITVGSKEEAMQRAFTLKDLHFVGSKPKKSVALRVRIRYNHQEVSAVLEGSHVHCKEPQFAVTPGQSAVFYHKDEVVGGGIIDEVA